MTGSSYNLRETVLPGPSQSTGYRTVLVLGPTGSGKTTLVRQLIGTDPLTEQFPSTSTSKTTICETELLLAPGDFYAVVTFMSRAEAISAIAESVTAAAMAIHDERPEEETRRRLLEHVDQRFRLYYVIGRGRLDPDETPDDTRRRPRPPSSASQIEAESATEELLVEVLGELGRMVDDEQAAFTPPDQAIDGDPALALREHLADRFVRSPVLEKVVYRLLTEVERRFDMLDTGELVRGRDGWPLYWAICEQDRAAFLTEVSQFTSNAASRFGTLLTPLVDGLRVRGPFSPTWAPEIPYLMLVDGEGLGHTPDTATSLPSNVIRMFDQTDTVMLVDDAQRPMQAASAAVLRELAATGHARKLAVCFTHFDMVDGPNLDTFTARRDHVLGSLEQIVRRVGSELGDASEEALRRRLEGHCFLVGGIDQALDPQLAPRTVPELVRLLDGLRAEGEPLGLGSVRPTYRRDAVLRAARDGVNQFHQAWAGRLGLEVTAGRAAHWSRLSALCVRYAGRISDEYESLRPVGDLVGHLADKLRAVISEPDAWDGTPPDPAEQQQIFDLLARSTTRRVRMLVTRRFFEEATADWIAARDVDGAGSTRRRAEMVAEILWRQAPAEGGGQVGNHADFIAALAAEFAASAELFGAHLTDDPSTPRSPIGRI